MKQRALTLGAWAGATLALIGALAVLVGDGPYLRLSSLSPWLMIFAVGLFGLLLFAPFAIHRLLAASSEDRDRRWELAVVAWGGLALALGGVFAVLALLEGFSTSSGLGALAVVAIFECALVVGAVLTMMLSSG